MADSTDAGETRLSPGGSLCVKTGYFEGLEFPLDRPRLVVGRGREADVVIPEPTISRLHAALVCDGQAFFVEDLGSTNGTRVNGGSPTGQALCSGDHVQMGKLTIGVTLPI